MKSGTNVILDLYFFSIYKQCIFYTLNECININYQIALGILT